MKKLLLAGATAAALGMGGQAFAQDCSGSPTVGATSSSCSTDLTLTVEEVVAVSGLQTTATIPYVVGTGADVDLDVPFCLATNAASTSVDISGTSVNTQGDNEFYVWDGAGTFPAGHILYNASVETIPLTEGGTDLAIGAPDTLNDCLTGTTGTATLNIAMTEAAQALAANGIYTDTLTLVVAPN
jgi:hypothetical protein